MQPADRDLLVRLVAAKRALGELLTQLTGGRALTADECRSLAEHLGDLMLRLRRRADDLDSTKGDTSSDHGC